MLYGTLDTGTDGSNPLGSVIITLKGLPGICVPAHLMKITNSPAMVGIYLAVRTWGSSGSFACTSTLNDPLTPCTLVVRVPVPAFLVSIVNSPQSPSLPFLKPGPCAFTIPAFAACLTLILKGLPGICVLDQNTATVYFPSSSALNLTL